MIRMLSVVLGALAVLAGLMLGLSTVQVEATTATGFGWVGCGSAWGPDDSQANVHDGVATLGRMLDGGTGADMRYTLRDCRAARASRSGVSASLLVAGLLLLGGGGASWGRRLLVRGRASNDERPQHLAAGIVGRPKS